MKHLSSPNDDLIIGIDGGGTKTVAWVAAVDDSTNRNILGRGHSGPSNPRSVGFEAAQFAIRDAIAVALTDAKRPQAPVSAAWLGLAGAGRESEQNHLELWASGKSAFARRVRVSGDAEPILASASLDHSGIALICGTGSLAWGRNQQGIVARAGGCGYLIGDEGSAYAIAIAAIRTAMQSTDGRQPFSQLLDKCLSYFNVASPENLIEILYSPDMTRSVIAGSAQFVFDLPEDSAAAAIIQRAADDLASMVLALVRRLHLLPNDYALALAGGLLLNQESFRRAIVDRLSASAVPSSITLVADPVIGAVNLARRLATSSTAFSA